MMDESLAGRVSVPVAKQVLWVLGDHDLGHMVPGDTWRAKLIDLIRSVHRPASPGAQDVWQVLSEEFPAYAAAVDAVTVGAQGEVDPEPLRRLVKAAEARYKEVARG